ncbi:MAG: hypothetical protein HYX72_13145 [Acidobacteria bacterium]|nr:hypothetical protein [Acidobacteriota bacterium]
MIFGFNTDVHVNDTTYHVQTEDRGAKKPIVDSMIYVGGKIVDRVRTPYDVGTVPQAEIEAMVRNQHRQLVEAIRSGELVPPSAPPPEPTADPSGYGIRLMNPREISMYGQFRFELCVWDRTKAAPAPGASLMLKWLDGTEEFQSLSLQTDENGAAVAWFPEPATPREMTLLVYATGGNTREVAKFRILPNSAASFSEKGET